MQNHHPGLHSTFPYLTAKRIKPSSVIQQNTIPVPQKKIARLTKKPVGILKESFCKAAGVAGRRTRALNFVDVSARKLLKKGGDAGHAHMQNIVLTMSFASVK